jgi:hypothetical protein
MKEGKCMKPICLHPENKKYFLFRGKATVLVTSASHYGAIINRKYDYVKELDELARHGLNLVRIFGGHYHEVPGDFGIGKNILAPLPEDYVVPFQKTTDGKYDLSLPNPEYDDRLVDYVQKCHERGIIVEMSIFCPFYHEGLWDVCPMNGKNNINGVGNTDKLSFHRLTDAATVQAQEAYVAHMLRTLNRFDNIYYEIMNEPWPNQVPLEFELHFADFIKGYEKALPLQHMVARNPANGWERVDEHKSIDLVNFHYASPPYAVEANKHLPCAVGLNETGFAGSDPATYRKQAWDFMMVGGSLFNNLDYSFAIGYEDGTWYDPKDPGAGSSELRSQLGTLKSFLMGADLTHLQPDMQPIKRCHALHGQGYCLKGKEEYLFYFRSHNELYVLLDLPAGDYECKWIKALSGEEKTEIIHIDGIYEFKYDQFSDIQELALHVRKKQ